MQKCVTFLKVCVLKLVPFYSVFKVVYHMSHGPYRWTGGLTKKRAIMFDQGKIWNTNLTNWHPSLSSSALQHHPAEGLEHYSAGTKFTLEITGRLNIDMGYRDNLF